MCVLSRQSELSALKKKSLAQRTLMELVQLMSPAVESEGDGEGRQSGSLEWRLARSETTVTTDSYVWTPTSQEVSIFSFNLLMYLHALLPWLFSTSVARNLLPSSLKRCRFISCNSWSNSLLIYVCGTVSHYLLKQL